MEQRKKKIEDPLKLLLPSVIYDYFELVHTEVSDIDVHLFLEEQYIPPQAVGYESKGFTEHSVIQDFPVIQFNLWNYPYGIERKFNI